MGLLAKIKEKLKVFRGAGMFAKDIGIDLGTASILVYVKGKGVVLREPSVVAMDKDKGTLLKVGTDAQQMLGRTPGNIVAIRPLREGVISDFDMTERVAMDKDKGTLLKVGTDAQQMLGRTPGNIVAIRPLREGVISDFDMTERMLKEFIRKAASFRLFKPRVVICVPSGITEVEERAVVDAGLPKSHRNLFRKYRGRSIHQNIQPNNGKQCLIFIMYIPNSPSLPLPIMRGVYWKTPFRV